MKEGKRKYTGPLQFFHNYEHSTEGRTHCKGPVSHPYRIRHSRSKHIITLEYARGHGKGRKTQWWRFLSRLGGGWDLSSGIKVSTPPSSWLKKVGRKGEK